MTRYPFPARRTWNVLFALYLLALVYLNRDSQAGLYLLGFFRAQALSIGLTLAVGLVFLVYNRNRIGSILLDGRVLLFVLFSLTIVIPMAIKRDWQMMYISMVYCIAVAVLISYFADIRQTARAYILILALLAAASILCSYGLRLLADRGVLVPPVFENSFQARFYNYLLCYVPINYAKARNFGIFREPGVYQFFLFLALYLNNYQADWDSGKRTWGLNALLVTAMLTTFSTCGVAVTAVFLIALYFDRKVYDTPLGRKLSLVLFALLALVAAWLVAAKPPLYTQLKLMVEKLFTSNPSLNDRIDCIKFNLYVIQWDRFVGRELAYILETVTHNTSSSTILFGILGLLFGWLNLFGWVTLVFRGRGHLPMKLVCLATLAATFNTENLITNPYFWLFPILALTEGLLPLANAPRKNLRKA